MQHEEFKIGIHVYGDTDLTPKVTDEQLLQIADTIEAAVRQLMADLLRIAPHSISISGTGGVPSTKVRNLHNQ